MKKLFSFTILIILSVGVSACTPSNEIYDDTEINTQLNEVIGDIQSMQINLATLYNYNDQELVNSLEDMQLKIETMQERLDNLKFTKGLNEQISVYENTKSALQTMSNTLTKIVNENANFNDLTAPAYIMDVDDNYISMDDLGKMLKLKYFGDDTIHDEDMYYMNGKSYMRFMIEDGMTDEELFARVILLIDEFRNYEFYALSCPELVISVYRFQNGDYSKIEISIHLTVVINDYFTITPIVILNEEFETRLTFNSISNIELIESDITTHYDYFVDNNTFTGFVLNYNE